MSILSASSGSNRFRLLTSLLILWLPARAARALLGALHESRMRAATKVFREFAHLNALNQRVAGQPPTPPQ